MSLSDSDTLNEDLLEKNLEIIDREIQNSLMKGVGPMARM